MVLNFRARGSGELAADAPTRVGVLCRNLGEAAASHPEGHTPIYGGDDSYVSIGGPLGLRLAVEAVEAEDVYVLCEPAMEYRGVAESGLQVVMNLVSDQPSSELATVTKVSSTLRERTGRDVIFYRTIKSRWVPE
jgi:hypothetical protein